MRRFISNSVIWCVGLSVDLLYGALRNHQCCCMARMVNSSVDILCVVLSLVLLYLRSITSSAVKWCVVLSSVVLYGV